MISLVVLNTNQHNFRKVFEFLYEKIRHYTKEGKIEI